MRKQSYRNPECVETIIGALASGTADDEKVSKARAKLAEGVAIDEIYWALGGNLVGATWDDYDSVWDGGWSIWDPPNRRIDPCPVLLAALHGGDFTTVPKIATVQSVKPRRSEFGSAGVNLFFADKETIAGDRVLLRLEPPAHDAQSALGRILLAHPEYTKEEARKMLRDEYGIELTDYAFTRLWPIARIAVGLPDRVPPGPHGPRRKFDK
jgi:hypothetical protein